MTDLTNTGNSQKEEIHSDVKNSPTFGKSNFKTFTLLRQQESLISQFETNLQKTLDLINGKTQTSAPLEQSTNQEKEIRPSNLDKLDISEIQVPRSDTKATILERENQLLKNEIKDLQRENELMRNSISTIASRPTADPKEKFDPILKENEDLKSKVSELTNEAESLRAEIIKVKTESFKKYEHLQKNNDELLISYEDRFKITMKNISDKHEIEVQDLRLEISRIEEQAKKNEENWRKQKEKLGLTIFELEREKQDLMSKLTQMHVMNENAMMSGMEGGSSSSAIMVEQILKEKHDLAKKYDDLFNSYSTLVDHNRSLAKRLEAVEKEKDDLGRRSTFSHEHSVLENHSIQQALNVNTEPTGRIRKNKDKNLGYNTNTSFTSNDEEKLTRSANLRSSEIYNGPSQNNSLLKPKNAQLTLDEMRPEVPNFDEKFRNSKFEKNGKPPSRLSNVSTPKGPTKKKSLLQSPALKESNKENKPERDNTKSKELSKQKDPVKTKDATPKSKENKENKSKNRDNKENRENRHQKEIKVQSNSTTANSTRDHFRESSHKRTDSKISQSARKTEIESIRTRDSLSRYKSEHREISDSSTFSTKNSLKPSMSKESLRQNHSPTSEISLKVSSSRPPTSGGHKIPVYSKISKK